MEAPVEPALGVSGLDIVATVFVPLALWFGIFGVGALGAFGDIPMDIFPTVLFEWVFGDIKVFTTIRTNLMVPLLPLFSEAALMLRAIFLNLLFFVLGFVCFAEKGRYLQ